MKRKRNFIGIALALLIGGVLGSVAGLLLTTFDPLAFLSQGKEIGISTGKIDLSLVTLNIDLNLRLSISAVVGILIGYVIYKKV